ncbi:MAG: hypothetical protein WC337_09000 [Candidatus Muiribacteriota bacterium]|jgi:hypothetical protein
MISQELWDKIRIIIMKNHLMIYDDRSKGYFSNHFYLFSGKGEMKDTKALGVVFSKNKIFLNDVLKKIQEKLIPKKNEYNVYIEPYVNAKKDKRIDILITYYNNKKEKVAIVFEAKNKTCVITESSRNKLNNQVVNYIDDIKKNFNVIDLIPVTLTKNKIIEKTNENQNYEIKNITWDEIIAMGNKEKFKNIELISEFISFLIKENKGMKYYEKEVLSFPAGKSINLIKKYGIYSCPNTSNYNKGCKKSLFLTFRGENSVMEFLYKLEDIIEINIDPQPDYKYIEQRLGKDVSQRVRGYLGDMKKAEFCNENKLRLYILNTDEKIKLDKKPKPETNIQGVAYFRLCDILSKEEIEVSSKKN